ncbi:Hpt domain-containing protein [Aliihoeflea sp. PC F10.4]
MTQISGNEHALIDEQVLERQTMGDHRLAAELLDMFVAQLDAATYEMAGSSVDRRMALAHALKGTARSLGIAEVAACAAMLEAPEATDAAISQLSALAGELRREVDSRRSGPA